MTISAQSTVEDALRELVASGMEPGDKLPPERELADTLSVSRMTLRAAVETLQFDGLLVRRPGRGGGTFVAAPPPTVELASVRGVLAQLRERLVESEVIEAGIVTDVPRDVRHALAIGKGEAAMRLYRVRRVADEPVMLEDSWLPGALVPGIESEDLTGSVYRLLRDRYESEPVGKREVLQPGIASPEEARLLGPGPRHPVLRITRTAYRADGRAVEYSQDAYRSDLLRIQVTTGIVG